MVITPEGSFFYITGTHSFKDAHKGCGIGFRKSGKLWYAFGYSNMDKELIHDN